MDYESGMITNASLLTPEILQKMKGLWKLKTLQLSMDGAEQDYIRRKQYTIYHDEYHTVMNNINLLADADIEVTIRCNVDEENWAGIPDFLNDLKTAVYRKEKLKLYFCPLNCVRSSEQCGSLYPCEYCPPQACYGDIFQGVTDEKARTDLAASAKPGQNAETVPSCRNAPPFPPARFRTPTAKKFESLWTV